MDVKIQQALKFASPTKTEDAITRALKLETAKTASKGHMLVHQTKECFNSRHESLRENSET